jgi:hypothetical protein
VYIPEIINATVAMPAQAGSNVFARHYYYTFALIHVSGRHPNGRNKESEKVERDGRYNGCTMWATIISTIARGYNGCTMWAIPGRAGASLCSCER